MTIWRHLVHEDVYDEYVGILAEKAAAIPVGDPATGARSACSSTRVSATRCTRLSRTVAAGATLAAGGTFDDLF